jgi:hypothetical protein
MHWLLLRASRDLNVKRATVASLDAPAPRYKVRGEDAMFNNYPRTQPERILRTNWVLTWDLSRPLRSNWSPDLAQKIPAIRTAGARELCNVAVIEECETSESRTRRGREAQSLTVGGK